MEHLTPHGIADHLIYPESPDHLEAFLKVERLPSPPLDPPSRALSEVEEKAMWDIWKVPLEEGGKR